MSAYHDHERRRQHRARQRRRRRLLALLVSAATLVGVLTLGLGGRNKEGLPEEELRLPDLPEIEEEVPASTAARENLLPPPDPKDDWSLILVNAGHPVPDDYAMTLVTIPNGLEVDERCYDDLMAMLDALYEEGLNPVICSAYRSVFHQETLYANMVDSYLYRGYSYAEAERLAAQEVAPPGASEHHLGLAVDIVDWDYQILDRQQEETDVQQWLMVNSWRYGFILRYPTDKTDITGIIYEPWHYRYVGRERAQQIYDSGLCLEEWLKTP